MVRILFLFLLLVFIFSCEEQGFIVKCSDCLAEEPLKINLDIKFDTDFSNNEVIINVYEGNIEDSILFKTYYSYGTYTAVPVSINKKYTVTAQYFKVGTRYIAVDSAIPRVKYEKDQCDEPCYFVYDTSIDLRLKYTK